MVKEAVLAVGGRWCRQDPSCENGCSTHIYLQRTFLGCAMLGGVGKTAVPAGSIVVMSRDEGARKWCEHKRREEGTRGVTRRR